MSQEAGTSGNTKILFFSLRHHFHGWVTGYASHSDSSTQVQRLATPLSGYTHFVLACKGGQSLHSALCRIELRTSLLTAQRFQPLNQVADGISCQNVSIYCPGCPRTSRNFKNSKFKFCKDQESNSVPRGCQCCQTPYTTRPKVLIQEQQIWKYKLDQTSSCQS